MKFRIKVPKTIYDLQHKGEHVFHMAYLGFAYVEVHGIHAVVVGGFFIVAFSGFFLHHEEG